MEQNTQQTIRMNQQKILMNKATIQPTMMGRERIL